MLAFDTLASAKFLSQTMHEKSLPSGFIAEIYQLKSMTIPYVPGLINQINYGPVEMVVEIN